MKIQKIFVCVALILLVADGWASPYCAQLLAGDTSDRKVLKYYQAIREEYGTRRATRSQIPLISHIEEGLALLTRLGADWRTKAAWCIHPLVQGDGELDRHFSRLASWDPTVVALALEYRNIANATLSQRNIQSLLDIPLSPLPAVNQMLVADKVQNRKDFERAHFGTHPRSLELDRYFRTWLARLGVSEQDYLDHVAALSVNVDAIATGSAPVIAKVGPYAAAHATVMFGSLFAEVYFPDESHGRFPVILFAHGGGLNGQSHGFLGRFWASHGFISVHPTLPGADEQILANSDRSTMTTEQKELNRQALIALGATRSPIDRSIRDMRAILDKLPQALRAIPGFRGKPDLERLGLAGYSYGAQVALTAAVTSIPEARAVLAISPPGRAFGSFDQQSWSALRTPLLLISGTQDLGLSGEPASYRAEPFWHSPEGNKTHALLEGVNHYSFVYERPGKEAFDQQVHEELKFLSLLLWSQWLEGRPGITELWESQALASRLDGLAKLFWR